MSFVRDRPTRLWAASCYLITLPNSLAFGGLVAMLGFTIWESMTFNEFYGLTSVVGNIGVMWVMVMILATVSHLLGMALIAHYCRRLRQKHPFIQGHADAIVQFQRRLWFYTVISGLLWTLFLMMVCGIGQTRMDEVYGLAIAAFFWLVGLWLLNMVATVSGTVHALRGRPYADPLTQL
jgi:uncharacterized Tic20 family protein